MVANDLTQNLLSVGFQPIKPWPNLHPFTLFLASHAKFHVDYTPAEIRNWLRVFLTRFFSNQFKRSCLPDGPKVGSVSVSLRGDWRMPSDASAKAWLERL